MAGRVSLDELRAELERSRGEVWSSPTLEIEAGRQDRRARIVVQSIPNSAFTALTFTSGGATGAEVGALRNALKTILETQGLMA
jgi:uroporphyrinogen-III synthase